MSVWPLMILGTFGLLNLGVMSVEFIRWQRRQHTENHSLTFTEHSSRSPWLAAFSGLGGTVYGLAGLAQLTTGFTRWPAMPAESAGAVLACCFMLAGAVGSYFAAKRAQRLARTGEPLIDERDQLIGLKVARAACAVVFVVLFARGFVNLFTEMMRPGFLDSHAPFAVFFTHFMSDPNWQTVMLGLIAAMVSSAYYRHRMM